MTQPQATAADTLNALQANLTKAFVEREDAQAKLDESNKAILAIRNVLAGVQMGQRLAAEQTPPPPTA